MAFSVLILVREFAGVYGLGSRCYFIGLGFGFGAVLFFIRYDFGDVIGVL